jgi:hypothetical protein
MTQIPEFAPGCFGSALGFRGADMVCRACQFASACEPVHLMVQEQLREKFGIKPKLEPVAARPTPLDPAAIKLPKKVRDLLDRLDQGDFDIVGSLRRGANPFGATMPFMAVACHLLLRRAEPFGRDYLAAALSHKFGWQPETAQEHARIAIYALLHVGAVNSNDGLISRKETA